MRAVFDSLLAARLVSIWIPCKVIHTRPLHNSLVRRVSHFFPSRPLPDFQEILVSRCKVQEREWVSEPEREREVKRARANDSTHTATLTMFFSKYILFTAAYHSSTVRRVCCCVLQCVAVCCSVLQWDAVCCSAIHCIGNALAEHGGHAKKKNTLCSDNFMCPNGIRPKLTYLQNEIFFDI